MTQIINSAELDEWLFDHAQLQGHICNGVKNADGENIEWEDEVTGETIDVIYATKEDNGK